MASSPGFGYVFIGQAQVAQFQQLGQRFFISYLPKTIPEVLEGQQVCLWLGPDFLKQEMMVFLIWPGRGIISFGFLLCARQPSRLVSIGKDVGTFESHPPNVVVYELLHYNEQPCMLFILWSNLPSAVLEDAQSLSFASLAQKWVNDLADFMEMAAIDDWDSAPAGQLHIWYKRSMETLRTSDPSHFLFDPTILSQRLMTHLQSTLLTRHNFAINKSGKGKTSVLIPLDFIRKWKDELLIGMGKDPAIIRGLLSPAA